MAPELVAQTYKPAAGPCRYHDSHLSLSGFEAGLSLRPRTQLEPTLRPGPGTNNWGRNATETRVAHNLKIS